MILKHSYPKWQCEKGCKLLTIIGQSVCNKNIDTTSCKSSQLGICPVPRPVSWDLRFNSRSLTLRPKGGRPSSGWNRVDARGDPQHFAAGSSGQHRLHLSLVELCGEPAVGRTENDKRNNSVVCWVQRYANVEKSKNQNVLQRYGHKLQEFCIDWLTNSQQPTAATGASAAAFAQRYNSIKLLGCTNKKRCPRSFRVGGPSASMNGWYVDYGYLMQK